MRTSVKSRYALSIMLDLAARYKASASVRDVAGRNEIPVKYAEKLFGILKRAGLVTVTRGASGGYRLSREPDSIRVLEIVRLMEGTDAQSDVDSSPAGALWRRLERAQNEALGVTLTDVLYKEI